MTTAHVFIVGSTLEEGRPQIDFEIVENANCVDWLKTSEILDGERDVSEYRAPSLVVPDANAVEWDFFRCSGTFGIVSKRASEVFEPFVTECFGFLPTFVNDRPYFLFRRTGSLDVLDRENTIGKVFPHDSSRYMRIDRFAFRKSDIDDPCIFSVPDTGYRVFATDSVEGAVRRARLRGFRFEDAESR